MHIEKEDIQAMSDWFLSSKDESIRKSGFC